jgi:acyl-CoA reductase-like NAD-dependent aldehyde dehydrogenase
MLVGPGESWIVHEPLGVTLIMGTWNFAGFTCLRPLISAITAGNCALIKPSELAPHCSKVIKSIITEFLDQTCYICVEGGARVACSLIEEQFDLIVYTGSTEKGRLVA